MSTDAEVEENDWIARIGMRQRVQVNHLRIHNNAQGAVPNGRCYEPKKS